MEAKTLKKNLYGVRLVYATRLASCWPGFDTSCQLGLRGYWIGTDQWHRYLGRVYPDAAIEGIFSPKNMEGGDE